MTIKLSLLISDKLIDTFFFYYYYLCKSTLKRHENKIILMFTNKMNIPIVPLTSAMIKGSANNCHHPVIQKAVFIQEASNVTNDQLCMAT